MRRLPNTGAVGSTVASTAVTVPPGVQTAPAASLATVITQGAPLQSQNLRVIPSNGRSQRLAQPLGGAWLAQKTTAEMERAKVDDLKDRRLKMEERLKRTVEFMLYHKVNSVQKTPNTPLVNNNDRLKVLPSLFAAILKVIPMFR